jgi:Flp pilus assembly protein TadG
MPTTHRPHRVVRRGWARLRAHPDAGEASISVVLLWPVVLLLVLVIIQASLVFFARSIALSAAEQGAQAARLEPASASSGQQAATTFLSSAASGLLVAPTAQASVTATSVRVQVNGQAASLVPGLQVPIHQESTQARERITAR